jgi:hypothetical protein
MNVLKGILELLFSSFEPLGALELLVFSFGYGVGVYVSLRFFIMPESLCET